MIAKEIASALERSSWIRKMFEEGDRLKKELGAGNVFDFTLGNPFGDPPAGFYEVLRELALNPRPGGHRYMPNAGCPEARAAVAAALNRGVGPGFEAEHIVMTCGAAGGMNVVLKSILDPGDEVLVPAPFFVEYGFYINNAGGRMVLVPTGPDFQIDPQKMAQALTEKTRAVIINSPNNPTGAVYAEETLGALAVALEAHSKRKKSKPVTVIADAPYKKIVYDGVRVPEFFSIFDNAVEVYSHSKDLNLPGERIGYIAVSPTTPGADQLMNALSFCNRTLGFVNAPALMQRIVARLQEIEVDVSDYSNKRDILVDHLTELGFELSKPQGAFYLFPKSPWEDDVAFARKAASLGILIVPGSGFGGPGYFRLAYCVDEDTVRNSLPAFEKLAAETGLQRP